MFDPSDRPNATWYTLDECISMRNESDLLHVYDVTDLTTDSRMMDLKIALRDRGLTFRLIGPGSLQIGNVWIHVISRRHEYWERRIDGCKYFLKQED